jgi:hypothetical protein
MDTFTTHDDSPGAPLTEPPALAPATAYNFTVPEWAALFALRMRYQQYHEILSARELAHLRFIRWLYRSGRLAA